MIFMGGKDAAYGRNRVAAEWGKKLTDLREGDPGGYDHKVKIYPQHGHWMNRDDREALPWMIVRRRNPWPKKIVWHQSGRTHDRFYWLSVPGGAARGGQTVRAEVKGQEILINAGGLEALTLRLHDQLLDLDQTVTVKADGKEVFKGKVERSMQSLWHSLTERADVSSAATALLELKL